MQKKLKRQESRKRIEVGKVGKVKKQEGRKSRKNWKSTKRRKSRNSRKAFSPKILIHPKAFLPNKYLSKKEIPLKLYALQYNKYQQIVFFDQKRFFLNQQRKKEEKN